jgi:hypothetical protein
VEDSRLGGAARHSGIPDGPCGTLHPLFGAAARAGGAREQVRREADGGNTGAWLARGAAWAPNRPLERHGQLVAEQLRHLRQLATAVADLRRGGGVCATTGVLQDASSVPVVIVAVRRPAPRPRLHPSWCSGLLQKPGTRELLSLLRIHVPLPMFTKFDLPTLIA